MITLIGAVFIAWTAVAVLFRRQWLIWALSGSVPFAATAAVTVGENSIPPFYIVSGVCTLFAAASWLTAKSRAKSPALGFLLVFTVVSLGVTFFAPRYFQGINVLVPRDGIDQQVLSPGFLEYSTSNTAQCLYLLLGGGVVLYLSQQKRLSVHVMAFGFAVGSVLSTARLALGDAWPSSIFDNYAGLKYWETAYLGEERFRGIFPEPSYLAVFSLAAICYFLAMVWRSRGSGRILYLALTASAAVNVGLSYSGTAAVGVLVMIVLAVLVGSHKFLMGKAKASPGVVLFGLAVLAILVFAAGPILDNISLLFADKTGSASYSNRSASDVFSLQLMLDTYGIGVGLGSNRPSSMLTMLASCVGVVGTVLFLLVLFFAIRGASRNISWRPAVWSLVGLLVAKFIAEPALSTPLLWFALGLCLYAAKEIQVDGESPDFVAAEITGQQPAAKIYARRAGSVL